MYLYPIYEEEFDDDNELIQANIIRYELRY